MSYQNITTLLRSIVDNEFNKRNSILNTDCEKALSILAANGLASSGVAVTTITNLCNSDLSERIHFIYENLKKIIEAKNISYDHGLHSKAKELVIELSKTAKDECLKAGSEIITRINKGSVEGYTQITDQKYQSELQEVLFEMEIYFDELKNKTIFTIKGWLKKNATSIILIIIAAIVGYMFDKIPF